MIQGGLEVEGWEAYREWPIKDISDECSQIFLKYDEMPWFEKFHKADVIPEVQNA